MRIAGSVMVALAAVFLLYRFCVLPSHCNGVRTKAEQQLAHAADPANALRAAELSREVLREIDPCLNSDPANVALLYIRATAFRLMGRNEQAVIAYEQALRYDRRPEILVDLGEALYDVGRTDEAVAHLLTAVKFLPSSINDIDNASARATVYERLSAEYARRGNLLQNPTFAREAANANIANDGTAPLQSVAAGWYAYNTPPGKVVIERVPTTFPGRSGTMLHVKTTHVDSGLVQIWGEWGTGPSQVTTSAWVFVNSGTVALGSGHVMRTQYDVMSKTHGRWEELRAPSGQCPVNQTMLMAATAGADFYVAEVRAEAVVSNLPCNAVLEPPGIE